MYRDIIHDTEIYQIILQEGAEQKEKQEIEDLYQAILSGVEDRFPELTEQARESVSAVTDLNVLNQVVRNMISVSSIDQAHALFEALKKKNQGH